MFAGDPVVQVCRSDARELRALFGKERLRPHLASTRLGTRLVALAVFVDDTKTLAPFENDGATLSTCATCDLQCEEEIPVLNLANAEAATSKEDKTVGELVRDCLEPPRQTKREHKTDPMSEMLKALEGN